MTQLAYAIKNKEESEWPIMAYPRVIMQYQPGSYFQIN